MKKVAYGHLVDIQIFKELLAKENIVSLVKNEYEEAASAGFGAGVPGNEDLFVEEKDYDKAVKIIEDYKKTQNS